MGMQTQCQFWRDVCDLRLAWGPDKKQQIPTGLRARLDDSADSLQHWLQQSQRLCRAVVTGTLPADNLMIDIYGLKKPENVSDSDYECTRAGILGLSVRFLGGEQLVAPERHR